MREDWITTVYCSEECVALAKAKRNKEKGERHRAAAALADVRSQRKGLSISEVIRWIQRYEERTGKLLSYGKAVPLMEAEQRAATEKRRQSGQKKPRS